MRKNYEMTDKQLAQLLDACKSVPYMIIGGNAIAAWKRLGEELGFDYTSVQPVQGMGMKFFTAEEK